MPARSMSTKEGAPSLPTPLFLSARVGGTETSNTPLINPQLLPNRIHPRLRRLIHLQHRRPRPCKPLSRPLRRRIDAHLAAEVRQPRSMIERIDRPQRELNVPLWVDVVR